MKNSHPDRARPTNGSDRGSLRDHDLTLIVVHTPALIVTGKNRRVLARAAQEAISQELQNMVFMRQVSVQLTTSAILQTLPSAQSAW